MSNALQEILNRATQRLMWFDQQPKAVREANAESERTLTNIIEIAQAAVGPVSPVRPWDSRCPFCGGNEAAQTTGPRGWACPHCHDGKDEPKASPVRDPAPPDYRSYALARAQDESKRLAALLAETAIERNDLLREREELLAGEHALSDAYVRLRSILGAFEYPASAHARTDLGAH